MLTNLIGGECRTQVDSLLLPSVAGHCNGILREDRLFFLVHVLGEEIVMEAVKALDHNVFTQLGVQD